MIAYIPLAMVISLIFSAGGLWSAFQDSEVDLGGVLGQFLLITVVMVVLLNILNRTLARYLNHPKIDLIAQGAERLANPTVIVGEAFVTPTAAPETVNALESGQKQ
jgi:hypothetical protein